MLTERAHELLEAIRNAGNWIDRTELAQATNKASLSPHDRILLDTMVNEGLIIVDEQPAGISKKYVYKAVDTTNHSLK